MAILTFIIILSILVLIHELGHFLVAKRFGIKVEEFGFGFPPRVIGKKIGETLYSINALPIGGFVKLFGEDEAGGGRVRPSASGQKQGADFNRAFFAKPIYKRALVVVAGVVMNFALAVVIVTYLFTFEGIPSPGRDIEITEVVENSPAQSSGLKKGDIIRKINGTKIESSESLISQTRENLGEETTILIERDGKLTAINVIPRKEYPADQGPMGIAVSQDIDVVKHPFPMSIFYGFKQAVSDAVLIIFAFKDMLVSLITQLSVPQGVAGPIGIAQLTGEFVKVGPNAVLALIYMLSLSLAVLNILPIPALDGGRLFFILIEAVTRRKVHPKFEAYAHMIGIVLLLTFLAFISFKDILRVISGESILPQ